MKTLTIKQPWAYAILAGIKKVENRSWKLYPGQYALHVAGRADPGWETNFFDPQFLETLRHWADTNLDKGMIIGTFNVSGVFDYKNVWSNPGAYPHEILLPRMVKPQSAKGQTGIWEFSGELIPMVKAI